MIYKIFNRFNIIAVLAISLGFVGCTDEETIEFEAPTGNVNAVQPNTLFTATTDADNDLGIIFRSFSTDAASYFWEFGDGSESTEENLDYVYQEGGLFDVVLTTTGSDGLQATANGQVSPVFVDFTVGVPVDSQVTFENLSSGANSLVWDFGDGETVEWEVEDGFDDPDFNPTHTYTTDDDFEVTLTVTNFLDREVTITKSVTGLVLSTVPDFTFTTSNLTATFTDASILAVSHEWDFGDDSPVSFDVNPVHTYATNGTFLVTLTTTNEAGVSRSIAKSVPVGGVEATVAAVILNGTMDDFEFDDGFDGDGNASVPPGLDNRTDNADAWDMTPSSTVVDNTGMTVPSPFNWSNSDLNDFIETLSTSNEAPGTTTNENTGRFAINLREIQRRAYQPIAVEVGVEYTITLWVRVEAAGELTLHILDNEITNESTLNEDALTEPLVVTGGVNNMNSYEQYSITFEATTTTALFYAIPTGELGSSNEVFIDDVEIITPGF